MPVHPDTQNTAETHFHWITGWDDKNQSTFISAFKRTKQRNQTGVKNFKNDLIYRVTQANIN